MPLVQPDRKDGRKKKRKEKKKVRKKERERERDRKKRKEGRRKKQILKFCSTPHSGNQMSRCLWTNAPNALSFWGEPWARVWIPGVV